MAVIEITSIDDATFEFKRGTIVVNKPRVYVAQLATKDYVRVEQVSTEHSDLFNPIIYSDLLIDGVVPVSAENAVSLLNVIVFSKAGGGGSAITTETVAEVTSKGDILYLDATGKYSLADALLSTKSKTRMVVATESGAINDEIKVGSEVLLDGYVGLVTGDNYYLNEGGGITNDPTVFQSGSITRLVGTAKSATELQVDIDTTFIQSGTVLGEQVWKDMVASFNQGKTTGGTSPIWEDTGNGIYAWKFVPGNKLQVSFHVNHDYAQTTDGYLHTHWIHKLAIAAAGVTTIWRLGWVRARGHSQGESLTAPLTYIDITHTSTGTEIAGDHIISEADLADAFDLLEPDTLVEVTVELLSTTLADKVYGKMCDIHYLADREGTPNKAPNFYA